MKSPALSALAASVLLAACASTQVADPTSRYYAIPPASTVLVQERIRIPPASAHAILQGGKLVAQADMRRYEPFCEIEVNDPLEQEQMILPGRFTISSITRQQEIGANPPPVLLAGTTLAGLGIGIGLGGSSGRFGWGLGTGFQMGQSSENGGSFALNVVHLRLKSAEQPAVRTLRCTGGWADLPNAVYPTLAEMRQSLGRLIALEIP